jgi:predicted nucleic acid-binding protein
MLSVIDTELWLSAVVETEVTVGAVVSVVDALSEDAVVDAASSLLLAQEMIVRLKSDMRITYKTLFIFFLQ